MLDVECRENKQSTKGQLRNALRKEKSSAKSARNFFFRFSQRRQCRDNFNTHCYAYNLQKNKSRALGRRSYLFVITYDDLITCPAGGYLHPNQIFSEKKTCAHSKAKSIIESAKAS